MLHHLTLWVPDRERAEESWSWLLGCLGYERDGGGRRRARCSVTRAASAWRSRSRPTWCRACSTAASGPGSTTSRSGSTVTSRSPTSWRTHRTRMVADGERLEREGDRRVPSERLQGRRHLRRRAAGDPPHRRRRLRGEDRPRDPGGDPRTGRLSTDDSGAPHRS